MLYKKMIMCFVVFFIGVHSALAFNDPVLTWDKNDDAQYYEVYVKTPGEEYTKVYTSSDQNDTVVNLRTLLINNEPLMPDLNYTFTVKAFNDCGNSSDYSDPVTYRVAVPGIVGTPIVNKSIISWSALPEAVQYKVLLVPTVLNVASITIDTTNVSIDTNTFTMVNNVPYTVTVMAVNDTGEWGPESNSVTFTRRSVRPCTNVKITKIPRAN